MVNLYPIISKLEQLMENTTCKGTSISSMLHDLADFREHDLQTIITALYEAQKEADELYTEFVEQPNQTKGAAA